MSTWHKIIIGDSRHMREVQLKEYGDEKQIGFHDTYERYINSLNLVWDECHRVLQNEEAIEFLRQKTRGREMFLKLDNIKHDDENNLLCYLYLRNKTFINAHLIKNGLADVDVAKDDKYKSNFVDYSRLT